MLVGNVISVASLSTRFTTGSTGLYAQFFASLLESWETFLGPSGEGNVDGCSHAGSKIGWARVNITELLGQLKSLPDSALTESCTVLIPLANLSKTPLTSPPFCMEMILSRSSSLTQTRNVLASLWKIPRPSGQSRSIPATFKFGSPDMKRKWSSTNCCLTPSSIPVNG